MARFTDLPYSRYGADDAVPQHGPIDRTQYIGTKGDDHIHGRKTTDTIDGLGGDDVLNARYGDDTLNGGKGNDVLKGSAGYDLLYGDAGDDIIYGGTERQENGNAGRDQLFGGSGDDQLYGGWEADVLEGGSGNDRFMYTKLSDSSLQFQDAIRDFQQGNDTLVFAGEYHDAGLHFIGDADFSRTMGEARFEAFDGSNLSVVELDVDGDGGADCRIIFVGEIQFQASDFSF